MSIFGPKLWKESLIVEISRLGRELLEFREDGLTNGEWLGTQFKSQADEFSHVRILECLKSIKSNTPVVSEEDTSSYKYIRENLYWLIDPVDGTRSYCEGFKGFVIQVCLMRESQPIWSCVHAPAERKTYTAEYGVGAFINGKIFTRAACPNRCVVVDNYPFPTGVSKRLYDGLPASGYLESGSLGLKVCKVADGQADLFVKDVELKTWDIAPAELFLSEVGGSLKDLSGRPINYCDSVELTRGLIAAGSQVDCVRAVAALK